ncbi:Glycosyltransferase involved in cell wall bisynthesis [Aquiflexum balticum DSM 16537]|uniref:Glycosyltransferase involved in cell wall bisynthesis n=1 Tax=Aquiflexum balticum DSM 16537 TaxID=758820 RepID=A0A1W2H7W6_9BACT|nr:glycosyltransferase family 4 protein [Aquiflexum balticum]SMD44626.1 Glycosyltransferase involved in cell wall bisynthesis [Aquiflexum balticum DSM 16537]
MANRKLKILYVHRGVEGKDGWGRSFFLASGMSKLGHSVTFMTTSFQRRFLKFEKKTIDGVLIYVFPDLLPLKLKASGFGIFSLFFKTVFVGFNKFDLIISDCGHRPSNFPAFINQFLFGSIHLTEWWDFYGDGGYYNEKPWYFRIFYGKLEKWLEIKSKKKADGVIVLSNWMFNKALSTGIKNVKIIHGGALTSKLKYQKPLPDRTGKIKLAYIGMADTELDLMIPFFNSLSDVRIKEKVIFLGFGNILNPLKKKQYGLDKILIEKGWIDYLNDTSVLEEIDVFVMIRKVNENALAGWPNKIGDYLALGRPILINPYGDLIDFVKDNPFGFIPVNFDEESIIQAIIKITSNKFDLIEMGEYNRALGESNSWEKKSGEIISFYKEITKE